MAIDFRYRTTSPAGWKRTRIRWTTLLSINLRNPPTNCWLRSSPTIQVSRAVVMPVAREADVVRREVASPRYRLPTRNSWTIWWQRWELPSLTLCVVLFPMNWNSPVSSTLTWWCISSPVTACLKASVFVVKDSPTGWYILTSNCGKFTDGKIQSQK